MLKPSDLAVAVQRRAAKRIQERHDTLFRFWGLSVTQALKNFPVLCKIQVMLPMEKHPSENNCLKKIIYFPATKVKIVLDRGRRSVPAKGSLRSSRER